MFVSISLYLFFSISDHSLPPCRSQLLFFALYSSFSYPFFTFSTLFPLFSLYIFLTLSLSCSSFTSTIVTKMIPKRSNVLLIAHSLYFSHPPCCHYPSVCVLQKRYYTVMKNRNGMCCNWTDSPKQRLRHWATNQEIV